MLFMRNLNIYSLRDLPQNKKKNKLTLMNFTKVQIIDTENAKENLKKKKTKNRTYKV